MKTEQPRDPADVGSPTVVAAWLRAAPTGGVHMRKRGAVRYLSWAQVLTDVERIANHLRAGGIEPGDRVGIRAENCYEWLALDLALLSLGARTVAIPVPDFAGRPLAEIEREYGIVMTFASRSGRAAGDGAVALETLTDLPALRPQPAPAQPRGERLPADERDYFSVVFSSGTAGRIKTLLMYWPGVHRLIEATVDAYAVDAADCIMIALPLSTFQQRYLCYLAIRTGCEIVLTTAARYLPALRETPPTILLGPPTFYEFALTRFENGEPAARAALLQQAGDTGAVGDPAAVAAARRELFAEYHALFGGRVRLMLVGSAPVRREMLEFFELAGFALFQIYGMTESGFLAWNRPGANRIGSVGPETHPGTVSIAPDGEVLVRHPWHICVGYEGEPAADVATVFRGDDVIATGDLGEFVDGYLYLWGRKKNVIVTAGGSKLQYEDIEAELCRADGVNQVTLIDPPDGAGMAVAVWFHGPKTAVREALRPRVQRVNLRLGTELRIGRIAFVEGELAQDSPLRNRNLKVDRAAVWSATASRWETSDW